MKVTKKNEIKQLLREIFWQLDHLENHEIAPELVRNFVRYNLDPEVLEATGILFKGPGFWDRMEKTCWLAVEARKYI